MNNVRPLISADPNIMVGKPVIAGTRITVEHIVRELVAGTTVDELLEGHPHISREQIEAAVEYGIAASAVAIGGVLERETA